MFTAANLSYNLDALEPYLSKNTVNIHYNMLHKGYVDKLNKLLSGTSWQFSSLLDVIKLSSTYSSPNSVFNCAAQIYNHDFYWQSMKPVGYNTSASKILELAIKNNFPNIETCIELFIHRAKNYFGSGYCWLIYSNSTKKIDIVTTDNADSPIIHNQTPLLCCDLWEHSYFMDYEADKDAYITNFITKLVNWSFASLNYEHRVL